MQRIEKVAVLGAGVMGAGIAAHLANAGLQVLLLDVLPHEPDALEKKHGLTTHDPAVRNHIAATAVEKLKSAKPAPLFLPAYAKNIEIGNFEDDAGKLGTCDWIIEAVVENMAVKTALFQGKVVPHLKDSAILSSNTSGLSVNDMAAALPEPVRRRFLVTHFFNPPRYMRLLEIVPCRETDPEVVSFMAHFLQKRVGKGVVFAKDTPNFIANRIGTYAGAITMKHMLETGLTVEEVDAITGVPMARPKTATFALWDLVGLDTVLHVTENAFRSLVTDDEREVFRVPEHAAHMVQEGLLGKKVGKGYYCKEEREGKTVRYFYDYRSGSYRESAAPTFPSVQAAKGIDDPAERLRTLISGGDNASLFAWRVLRDTLIYAVKRIPEIADDVVNIDNAMKWGYNWELGPFEILDALGVPAFVKRAEVDGAGVPELLKKVERFYRREGAADSYYSIPDGDFRPVPTTPERVSLTVLKRSGGEIERSSGASIVDLGDGIFCLEFHSKMNTIGPDILSMMHKAVQRAERDGAGLVVGNQGTLFSAGANLMLLATAIAEGDYDEIALTVKSFQKGMMALKYSKIPVVAAPHNLALGGACETCLHADAINAYAETYMGLVEIGVGLLPAGGGTKEMALRAMKLAEENEADVAPFIFKHFQQIGMAKVSTSAAELYGLGYLRHGDTVTMGMDRLIHDAKLKALALAANYRPGAPETDLKAPGRSVAASMKVQLWNLEQGGYISEYDHYLAATIADVITGGDVPGGTRITEEYLLELEREAFLKLCGQKKTLERIQHMLKKGKALRN
ncbi:3-hydroxyacyl-CoA dehydrogenase/enoyl-CoA hydratase family protein [Geomonas sp. RF6]|uniref:3-hydroxyacyl-CoA dehydrogenase/enoyl-CoA hydratase family protein n=1 Tax=Geomonas sp. RF6 TaxID=2897342 RepID=UPI001E40B4F4|nr:3-hydroxyacyl-CoA dehydrogenase/enoyl-CoA hydratase family protein [Geomonas sp. RF6]UFS70025.1 3-hydroxyacyl-CoA dehydrogenase/enoyl-CoA hydratase family protein [Geomonas sp. RF6]